MQRALCLITAIEAALASHCASATVLRQNPNAIISIIGPEAYNVPAPGEAIGPFAVRLVDPQGQPIQGLTVDFYTNAYACFPTAPGCTNPPPEMFGHFEGNNVTGVSVLTDADGVAVLTRYYGGTVPGKYQVAAYVPLYAHDYNREVLKTYPEPVALFDVTQFAAPLVTVPAFGPFTGWALIAGIVLAAILARLGTGWRKRAPLVHRVLRLRR